MEQGLYIVLDRCQWFTANCYQSSSDKVYFSAFLIAKMCS